MPLWRKIILLSHMCCGIRRAGSAVVSTFFIISPGINFMDAESYLLLPHDARCIKTRGSESSLPSAKPRGYVARDAGGEHAHTRPSPCFVPIRARQTPIRGGSASAHGCGGTACLPNYPQRGRRRRPGRDRARKRSGRGKVTSAPHCSQRSRWLLARPGVIRQSPPTRSEWDVCSAAPAPSFPPWWSDLQCRAAPDPWSMHRTTCTAVFMR